MYLFHDSRHLAYRTPFGAAPVGGQVTLTLDCQIPEGSRVYLRLWHSGQRRIPMASVAQDRYSAVIDLPDTPGLLWYYFLVETPEQVVYYGKSPQTHGGVGAVTHSPPDSWQITVYRPTALPRWYQGKTAYQIFPDRFHRGQDWARCQENAAHPPHWRGTKRLVAQDWDDTPFYCKDAAGRVTRWPFFGGTLDGIREKLPYLKSLGVGVLYLNPIFLASSNHKYDTADYLTIDPAFGTVEDFSRLCAEAKDAGIGILLDGVFSHTGDDSIYFNRYGNYPAPGAFSPQPSPYDSWYRFGTSNACGYECWWGVDSLPDVEETDPGYVEFICGENGVIRTWLRRGASGWRLDVADELPDSFIRSIRTAALAEKPDALLLGEVWEDASNKESYGVLRQYLLGEELDCTMHYPFRAGGIDFLLGRISSLGFAEAMDAIRENYPPAALYGALNLIGTHDTPRILTLLGEAPEDLSEAAQADFRLSPAQRALALSRLKLLMAIQFTLPGVPCVYYGDEAGMEGYADPYNRGTFPWDHGDGNLTFWVRMLSGLRQEYPVLTEGTVQYLAPAPDVFALRRRLGDAEATLYVNRGHTPQWVFWSRAASMDLFTGEVYPQTSPGAALAPLSAILVYGEGNDPSAFSPLPSCAQMPAGRGLLCPLFSLPGDKPTGTMGREALAFLRILREGGWKNWMLLPLCPPGAGNSPYSGQCVFAGDPRLIAPEIPVSMEGFDGFCKESEYWLEDYALYTILRNVYHAPWQQWPKPQRDRENLPQLRRQYQKEIQTIKETQYRFFSQWNRLHSAARAMGISLIGDLPIYPALDSAQTWAHRELFDLDDQGMPRMRAGCPPDYFTPEGQDWGNPLYRWDVMAQDGYDWWKRRLRQAFSNFDYVRLDHFRSFAAYYAIAAGDTASHGHWIKGAGIGFFREMAKEFGSLPIVAEDLGELDQQVTVLLRHTGLAGMNVWQFSQEEMAAMAPEVAKNRVFFSGTHDNQTLRGFLWETGDRRDPEEILRGLLSAPAGAVILPVQDVLGLGDEARINVPGVPTGNWTWRMTAAQLDALGRSPL